MQGYTLNAELISNRKFDSSSLEEIKSLMETKEDFIAFYSIFIESMQMNFSKYLEISVEDLILEIDLQNEIHHMLMDLDLLIPGGLANDSKIEWTSGISPVTVVWYKDNNTWVETVLESDVEFLDEDWSDEDDFGSDPYEKRYPSSLDDDNW